MKINSKLALLAPLVLAAGVIGVSMSGAVQAAPVSGSSSTGSACTVTSGANKGKTGTYTTEEGTGAQWCEGSWGGTECTGGGKCKDAAMRSIFLPVAPKVGTFSFIR